MFSLTQAAAQRFKLLCCKPLQKPLLWAVLTLLLTSCSSTTFVYNRLDVILPWYLSDYVELDRAQKKQLDLLLQPFLTWHRQQELPRYLALLQRAEAMLDKPLTLAELDDLVAELEVAMNRIQERSLEDWLLPLGEELSEAQLAKFITVLEDKQQALEKEYLQRSEKAYHKETYKRFRRAFHTYLGRLTQEQRLVLNEAVASMKRADQLWLQERQAWIERLRCILQRDDNWQQELREALAERQEIGSPEYQELFQHNFAVIKQTVVVLVNSRSERQDRRLRHKLTSLQRDMARLKQ